MNRYMKQMFADPTTGYDNNGYCDFSASAAQAVAGKDLVLAVWNATGTKLLAVEGQQTLTINRSADTIEVTSKDTEGGWKSSIAGMREWSIDQDGMYVMDGDAHKALGAAFNDGSLVCIKVYNTKKKAGVFGGLACITEYNVEAPYDDAMSYSISLQGAGPLVDLIENKPNPDTAPQ